MGAESEGSRVGQDRTDNDLSKNHLPLVRLTRTVRINPWALLSALHPKYAHSRHVEERESSTGCSRPAVDVSLSFRVNRLQKWWLCLFEPAMIRPTFSRSRYFRNNFDFCQMSDVVPSSGSTDLLRAGNLSSCITVAMYKPYTTTV